MNWYRQLKLAMPVMETPAGKQWFDIGHDSYSNIPVPEHHIEELWVIDNNWKLHVETAEKQDHMDMIDRLGIDDFIASGRFHTTDESPNGEASVAINPTKIKGHPNKKTFIQNKINNILDSHYGYMIKIMYFG